MLPNVSGLESIYNDRQKMIRAAEIIEDNSAVTISEKLYNAILSFQKSLPDKDDVALQIVQFGNSVTILVERIGYIGNNLVVFAGKDNSGNPMELIQHINQLSFLMAVASKPKIDEPKRTIGFAQEWD